ncbi:unnamed protein product [Amoebophrya sp. A25]|nr:unnamed protein product [Amoebophrya sp. A25]|eukprot:GSA25T00005688001.1
MATASAQISRRRSSCTADSWAKFRLLYSQDQLDRLSFVFGELENDDKLGENMCVVDKRLQAVGERCFGADLVRDMTRDLVDAVYQKTLQKFLTKEGESMTFEQYLNFIHTFGVLMQEHHPWRGYPQTFAMRVQTAMKERGAQRVVDIPDLQKIKKEESDDEEDDDKVAELISKSMAVRNKDKKEEIAIKTNALFKVLKDLGIETGEGDDQKRILREMQKLDAEETGWFTSDQMLSLFRELDQHWESIERKQQIAIIDETNYMERDVDNLKAIFNEYAKPDETARGPTLGVSEFRDFFRALQMNLNKKDTIRLKDCMMGTKSADHAAERIDFTGFCSAMKKLENEDFCGLKAIMGRKDEVDVDLDLSAATRHRSFFERKAASTRARNSQAASAMQAAKNE